MKTYFRPNLTVKLKFNMIFRELETKLNTRVPKNQRNSKTSSKVIQVKIQR